MLLSIWPYCLHSTLSEVEQDRLIQSALEHSSSATAAIRLGLASSHPHLNQTATDALVERIKRDGSKAVEAVVADKELLAALAQPDLLPRLANTRLFPAVSQQLVQTIRKQAPTSTAQQQPKSAVHREDGLPVVLRCPVCQSQLASAAEAKDDHAAATTLSTDAGTALLPLSLAHLVTNRLYPQAAHLVYSVLQTHEYMRSLPAGLAEVHARLKAASRQAVDRVEAAGGREQLTLYEAALAQMKDDRVGQHR